MQMWGAFGALRVMIDLNQLGEAAGVAAYLSLQKDNKISEILVLRKVKTLAK